MTIEELNKIYHLAYQSLVDTIEEFVVNKGKTLQQGFYFGEKKLNRWDQLSKEEVQEISAELRQNLQNLDEHLNEAKKPFENEFKQHAAFVTDLILAQLLRIINSSTE